MPRTHIFHTKKCKLVNNISERWTVYGQSMNRENNNFSEVKQNCYNSQFVLAHIYIFDLPKFIVYQQNIFVFVPKISSHIYRTLPFECQDLHEYCSVSSFAVLVFLLSLRFAHFRLGWFQCLQWEY